MMKLCNKQVPFLAGLRVGDGAAGGGADGGGRVRQQRRASSEIINSD